MTLQAYNRRIGIALLVCGFLAAAFLLSDRFDYRSVQDKKPISSMKSAAVRINASTPVLFEKEYLLSKQREIARCEFKSELLGKTLAEIKETYTEANGFLVTYSGGELLIRQEINDYSPADKKKCRLKEYEGMVAVYQGPTPQDDFLLRVTNIKFKSLPARIQEAILAGHYEFKTESELNDALENLDEYLP